MIEERQKIIKKYKEIYLKYPNIYFNKLRKIGTFYVLNNNSRLAREQFIQAIKIKPFSKVYINLILSFNPQLYKKVLSIKKITKRTLFVY